MHRDISCRGKAKTNNHLFILSKAGVALGRVEGWAYAKNSHKGTKKHKDTSASGGRK